MDNLQRLIQLAKADGGKFVVIDEKGEPSLVILSVQEYEKLLLKKVSDTASDIEEINKQIIEVQKEQTSRAPTTRQNLQEDLVSEVIDSTFSFEPDNVQRAELEDI